MKLIEAPQKSVEKDSLQKIIDQARTLLSLGKTEEHAEDAIIARFMRGLDDRFFMVRNLQFEGPGVIFPPILIGPAGLFVLNISGAKGIFKAKDESWWEMSKTSHRYGPGHPNLIKQSLANSQKLGGILEAKGKILPEISPILVFANPGVHVEMSTPAIRIVLMDGVENLIASLLSAEEVLNPNEITILSASLEVKANPQKTILMGEGEDFFGRDLLEPEKKALPKLPKVSLPTKLSLGPVEEKLKFTRQQWRILEVLLALTIIVLLGGIIYVLLTY